MQNLTEHHKFEQEDPFDILFFSFCIFIHWPISIKLLIMFNYSLVINTSCTKTLIFFYHFGYIYPFFVCIKLIEVS